MNPTDSITPDGRAAGNSVETPFVSIITAVLNARTFIRDVIQNICDQRGVAVEHIVLDGGSTDGTREILAEYPHLRLIAEPDRGAHDALNKGVAMARGEIIGFVNADDLCGTGLLAAVARRFRDEPKLDALLTRSYVFVSDGDTARTVLAHPLCRQGGFDLRDLMYGIPCLNARFFRRKLFAGAEPFDLRFRVGADRHLLIRLAFAGVKGGILEAPGYFYRSHPGSATLDPGRKAAAAIGLEHMAIATSLLLSASPAQRRALRGWFAYESARALYRGAVLRASTLTALPRGLQGKFRWIRHRRQTIRTTILPPPPSVNSCVTERR